jgi:hypothetical protein
VNYSTNIDPAIPLPAHAALPLVGFLGFVIYTACFVVPLGPNARGPGVHIGLPMLAEHIEGYERTKSALHFGPDEPLPPSLVRKLLEARIPEGKRRQV